jgi:hypothetical protein
LRILNWFLIENLAFGRQVRRATAGTLCAIIPNDIEEPEAGRGTFHVAMRWSGPEVKMVLFSRSFIRKRVISLVTTALVAATSFALAQVPTRAYHVRGTIPIQYVADRPDQSREQSFLSENDAAMNKMMADMTIKPTGDIDRDFVAMMVPHHQGAVDMAQAELKYGGNEQLRRLAQEIIAAQQKEIAFMRRAVDERPSPAGSTAQPAPASNPPPMSQETMGMSHDAMPHN